MLIIFIIIDMIDDSIIQNVVIIIIIIIYYIILCFIHNISLWVGILIPARCSYLNRVETDYWYLLFKFSGCSRWNVLETIYYYKMVSCFQDWCNSFTIYTRSNCDIIYFIFVIIVLHGLQQQQCLDVDARIYYII